MCHCSRRFSRLDNLRQHAQTVHMNEDIPIDSLAATGSRFQRQIRTDRTRQIAGNRARASTGGSAGGPRGHSKSLSTSSINSVGSVGSAYGFQPDNRRRPPPLLMGGDPRSSVDSYRTVDSAYSGRPGSPGDFSTPTSATFSTAQSSPRWPGDVTSPVSGHSHSRSHSLYMENSRTHARRLSVPSGMPPFQAGQGHVPGRPSFGPALVNSSNPGAFSQVASPPTSSSGWSSRRDSTSSAAAAEDWRRRTWHPDSRYNGQQPTQLGSVANTSPSAPNPPPPMATPTSPQANLRLPGIASFDPLVHRPGTPPRRGASPMVVDSEQAPAQRPPYAPSLMEGPPIEERRNLNMYDASLQRGITRLDISRNTPPRDGASSWASEANSAVQAQAERAQGHVRFEEPKQQSREYAAPRQPMHQHTMSAPSFASTRDNRRHGWYRGPPSAHQQPAQEAKGPHVDRMVHPNFTGFSGFPTNEQQPQQPQEHANNADSLRRLEALVAVATSEGSTATAY
mgnify:CR=1 FL=1